MYIGWSIQLLFVEDTGRNAREPTGLCNRSIVESQGFVGRSINKTSGVCGDTLSMTGHLPVLKWNIHMSLGKLGRSVIVHFKSPLLQNILTLFLQFDSWDANSMFLVFSAAHLPCKSKEKVFMVSSD